MAEFKHKKSEIVAVLNPSENNPRNSEGDFIELKDGRILFAYSRYTGSRSEDDRPCDIACIYSHDGGKSFDMAPRILKKASEHNVENIMSVSLLRLQNGDLGLFYLIKHKDALTSDYVLCRSADEGETFYSAVSCFSPHNPEYYVVNNNRVLRTKSGRLIVPAALHRRHPKNIIYGIDPALAVFSYSDDDGFTWKSFSGTLACPVYRSETGLQEPGVIELNNGVLYAYFRTDLMCQYESFSLDGGKSWTLPQPSAFTSPVSPLKIAQNPYTGLYYAVWNPIPNYQGRDKNLHENTSLSWGRTPLVIAESEDGINFSDYCIIEDDPEAGFCYPAIYFTGENSMLLSYCSGDKTCHSCLCRTTIRKLEW
ncbi:MAG: exo-alpha-sialidase [Clostridiales bacterium]|nr:exo-alpha-sialidase [Clostridiales bacterium]